MDHLDNQNILNENQHGFRAKRSCESQGPVALLGLNLFNAFSTPFSLILMSFIGLNGEFPFDGILVVFSVVNTDIN
jgi:hypothetical protein